MQDIVRHVSRWSDTLSPVLQAKQDEEARVHCCQARREADVQGRADSCHHNGFAAEGAAGLNLTHFYQKSDHIFVSFLSLIHFLLF